MSFAIYLIFLAFIYVRPFETFWPGLEAYRPMLVLSGTCLVVATFAVLSRGAVAARPRHFALLGGFVLAVVLSLVVNGDGPGAALEAMFEFSFSAIVFCVTVMCVNSVTRLRSACLVLAFAMVALAAGGIAAYYRGFMVEQLVLRQGVDSEGTGAMLDPDAIPADDDSGLFFWRVRSVGFLADPNDFAQMLVAALPLLWALWVRRRWLRNLVLVLLPTFVVGWAMYLTHSRGALVALSAVLFFAVRRSIGVVASGALIAVAAMGALLLGATGGRGFSTSEDSAAGRLDAWGEGIMMFRSHPLFGVGYGNFEDYNAPLTAHNSFVLCFSELGFFGYFLWMAMIVVALMELSAVVARTDAAPLHRTWARAIQLGLIGFLVAAWFLSRVYQPGLYTLLGLAVAAANLPPAPQPAPRLRWAGPTFAASLGGIAAVFAAVVSQRFVN